MSDRREEGRKGRCMRSEVGISKKRKGKGRKGKESKGRKEARKRKKR